MTADEFTLNQTQKDQLLNIARQTINAGVKNENTPTDQATDDVVLNAQCGCFVTIHNAGKLRGCIGTFKASSPLYKTITEMARASLDDPRFTDNPVTADELAEIDIEISVLSPLQPTDDPLSLELGRHGIYITQGFQNGCFLPQVADQTGWSKEQFLSYCCLHKAGLPVDAWQSEETQVCLFTAEVFGEKKSTRSD